MTLNMGHDTCHGRIGQDHSSSNAFTGSPAWGVLKILPSETIECVGEKDKPRLDNNPLTRQYILVDLSRDTLASSYAGHT